MTSSTMTEEKPNPLRVIAAWGVHLFTATGAAWGFLTLLAIFEHNWRAMMLWMVVAVLVDGVDGTLARWADVKTYANGIDGALLDNILDYLNYVIAPALFLMEADVLPNGFQLFGACSILITSAYQFTQTDAKVDAETDAHHFKGFPSYWNVVALYMLLLGLPAWVNFGLLMLFNVMVFIPIKYIYPTRAQRLPKLTLALTYLYGALGIWALFQYPNTPRWLLGASFAYVGYYFVLSLLPQKSNAN